MIPKLRTIVLFGYLAVGKTSLCTQFVDSEFTQSYDPTIENTFVKTTTINNEEYEIILADTAGQEEFYILLSEYFMCTHGYILVYSITSRKSFEVVKIIREKVLNMHGIKEVPIFLVGNKKDLYAQRVVTEEEGRDLANLWKAKFFEVSAKQNECVSSVIHNIVMELDKFYNDIQTNQFDCSICSIL